MDPFNMDLSDVDTTPARLNKGKYAMKIKEIKFETSKKDESKTNLLVVFSTLNDQTAQTGLVLNAGYQCRSYLPCQQSDNEKAPDFRIKIAKLLDAAFGNPTVRPRLNPETLAAMADKELMVTVGFEVVDGFGPSNDVKDFTAIVEE
jgi:hypothetical protein